MSHDSDTTANVAPPEIHFARNFYAPCEHLRKAWTTTHLTFTDNVRTGRGSLVEIVWPPVNPTPEKRAIFNAHHDSMRNGWGGSLDKLAAYLKS